MQPADVREAIDSVIDVPFDALPTVLDGFTWTYEKVRPGVLCRALLAMPRQNRRLQERTEALALGCAQGDFYHWVALFNYFDELLEKFVKPRKDLQLDIDGGSDSAPFPSSSILAILRVSATIMENCSNKHLYHSYEVRRRTLFPFLLCSCAHGPSASAAARTVPPCHVPGRHHHHRPGCCACKGG